MDKIYISLDTLETYLSHQLYVTTGVNCMDEGQVTCNKSIYSFLNCLFESIKRVFKIDFFSRLNLDSANKWISQMTITGAQQTTKPKTSVIVSWKLLLLCTNYLIVSILELIVMSEIPEQFKICQKNNKYFQLSGNVPWLID